jgi:serine/threonine protein kinase
MTTLFHSGHKLLQTTHLFDARRAGAASSCLPAGFVSSYLGQYRILECLGSGGMGQVFLAEHPLMGRKVAIKVMAPNLLSDADSCARFRQEVRLVSQLSNPHIVLAHDASEADGVHFFVMEYVQGADLGHIVAHYGALPIPFVCECIRQAALGLQHAHEHGLVHCDIKPSNLLLRGGMTTVYNYLGRTASQAPPEQPHVKILDFGLARLAGKAGTLAAQTTTAGSSLCGTPDYMAPELGRDSTMVDIRCDLYSLGCTFSFLLTGQVPYPGGSWSEKLIRHHYDPAVPLCRTRPDVPDAIEGIVSRLMAKDPADRFATPGEVAGSIECWQQEERPRTASRAVVVTKSFHSSPEHALTTITPSSPDPSSSDADLTSPAADRRPRRTSSLILWPLAACLAIAGGLGSAWLVTNPRMGKSVGTMQDWARKASGQTGFRIGRNGPMYSRLDLAVAEAADRDTIWVQGNGPFLLHGISCHDKTLTIKADEGFHPTFELLPEAHSSSWTPLFWSNRGLTLDGIGLRNSAEKNGLTGPMVAHLVYGEGAALKLVNCELLAPASQALIVARQASAIELENCTLEAAGSALCVELRDHGPTRIVLDRSKIKVRGRDAASVVVWSDGSASAPCEIDLNQAELVGPRLLTFNGLANPVSVRANGTDFQFRQTLVTFNSPGDLSNLENQFHWTGSNNHFSQAANWISSHTSGATVHNLQDWKQRFQCTESNSTEETMARLSKDARSPN